MGRWAAVVRVSHMGERRAGSEGFHADREQLDPIERWAGGRGATLDVLPPELGISGGLPLERRPSLKRAVEGIEAGEYAGIVVAYLSRLGRNVQEQLRVWDRVQEAGGEIVSIREGIDTTTAAGRLHRNLLISIDAHYREEHAERFEERRRLATEAGIWQRRQTPTGYRRDPATRRLVPTDPERVGEAFRRCIAGEPMVRIAEGLGMTPSGARQLLRNRVYLGELRVGQHVNPAAHPPIIDPETFEAAQERLERGPRPGRHRPPALLAGLIRCVSCGHVMTRGSEKGGASYRCVKRHSGGSCPDPAAISVTAADRFVMDLALSELAHLRATPKSSGAEEARQALAEAERELDAYLEAVSPADVGAEAFGRAARVRREAVDACRDALRIALARSPAEGFASPDELWEGLSSHERNTLLRGLFDAVVVRPVGRGRRVPVSERVRVFGPDAISLPRRSSGGGVGIVPLPFPDRDDPGVVRVALVENGLQDEGGA